MNTKKPFSLYQQLSWLTFVKAFWNNKAIATVIAIAVSASGIVIVRRLSPVYRAESLILVDTQKIPERFVATTVTEEVQDRLTTISQEILSSTRLDRIIHDFNLYAKERKTYVPEEIIEMMRKDIEVKVEKPGGGGRPGAFRISFQGKDPVIVAQVTNRIANLYIEANLRTREVLAEGATDFIEHQLQEAKSQLDSLEASVSRYKLAHNGELPQQESSIAGTLGRLQTELNGVQDAISRAEQNKLVVQNSLALAEDNEATLSRMLRPASAPRESASGGATEDAVVFVPPEESEVDRLTAQMQSLRLRLTDEHPEVKRAKRELERATAIAKNQERAAKTRDKSLSVPTRRDPVDTALIATQLLQARERTANLRAQIKALDGEIANSQNQRTRILADISAYQARMERLPVREQEMASLTRDYDMAKSNYRSLLEKKAAAEMASDLERRQKGERFTVLDPAKVPEKPAKPKRLVLYGVSLVAGIAFGVAAAIGKGLMRNQVLGEWELPVDIPLLGRVPRVDVNALKSRSSQLGAAGSIVIIVIVLSAAVACRMPLQ